MGLFSPTISRVPHMPPFSICNSVQPRVTCNVALGCTQLCRTICVELLGGKFCLHAGDKLCIFLVYAYAGHLPDIKRQIVDMAQNASGIRDTTWVLHIRSSTAMKELKKGNGQKKGV